MATTAMYQCASFRGAQSPVFRRSQVARRAAPASAGNARRTDDVSDGVLIAGAGLAGLCTAAALRKVGIPYLVLEQRGELSAEGAAIALWGNAMKALEQIGVADAVRSEFTPLDTVRICRNSGKILKEFGFADCSGGTPELIGVARPRLQQLLLEAAGSDRVLLDAEVAEVHTDVGTKPRVTLKDGREIEAKLVLGADGVKSAVAAAVRVPPVRFAGQAGFRGIAEFSTAAPVAARTVCQIFGEGIRAGMYPMSDTEVYWFVAFDDDGAAATMPPVERKAEARRMVQGWAHGIEECVASTAPERVSRNRFFDRFPSPLGGPLGDGNVTLAGDALHPMTPNLGQGGCVALEDGIVLAQCLREEWATTDDLSTVLGKYERLRAQRCLPLAVRSRGMGAVLQSALPPVVFARDTVVSRFLDPGHFFDHTLFDVGELLQHDAQ